MSLATVAVTAFKLREVSAMAKNGQDTKNRRDPALAKEYLTAAEAMEFLGVGAQTLGSSLAGFGPLAHQLVEGDGQ